MHKALPTSPGYTLTQYLVPHPFSGTWNQTLSFKGDLKAGRHAESLSLNVSRSNGGVVLSARTSKSMYPSWVHTAAVTKVHIKLSHQSVRAQSAKSCCVLAADTLPCEGLVQEQAMLKDYWAAHWTESIVNSVTYLLVHVCHRGTLDTSPLPWSSHWSENPVLKRACKTEVLSSSPNVAERQELLAWSVDTRAYFNTCMC